MKTLNICTYNVRNDNLIEGFDENRIAELYKKLIKDYKIDILATQEMISSTVKIIQEQLKGYHVIGNYRYGKSKIIKKIKSIEKYNEANNIITKLPILTEKTTELPWIPRNIKEILSGTFKYRSITPRILTEAILDIEDYGRVRFLNTHLSHHLTGTTKLQLKKISKKIKSSTIPVILTGDFNTNIKNKNFKLFISELEKLGLKRVEINEKTFKKAKNNNAIDHIFIPSDWKVIEYKIIKDDYLEGYSDHYPILISVIPDNNL